LGQKHVRSGVGPDDHCTAVGIDEFGHLPIRLAELGEDGSRMSGEGYPNGRRNDAAPTFIQRRWRT
jgi:hypothetical protein